MTEAEKFMAENCYGYGRWDAPYWFFGPEQGLKDGTLDEFIKRYEAFRDLNKDGLCDCRAFHAAIGETRWHRQDPELQKTWKFLILLLLTYLEEPQTTRAANSISDILGAAQKARLRNRAFGDPCEEF
jgi:hypothetical protein